MSSKSVDVNLLRAFWLAALSLLLTSFIAVAMAQSVRIAVISDVHVMDPALLEQEGAAFDEYLRNDRKMLTESVSLAAKLRDRLLAQRPDVVLLTGDLTKDGEMASHRKLREVLLDPLAKAGIRTLVIPGNHDVNNPHAVRFAGDTTFRVPTVSRGEFAEIYADYGYADALSRDTASLSYVAQLAPGFRILALDACRYDDNDFAANICHHSGRLKPSTWDFALREMKEAKRLGQRMVCMIHHGMVEHWKYQDEMIPGYTVDGWRRYAKELLRNDVHLVFTGHSHTQDIVSFGGHIDMESVSVSEDRMECPEEPTNALYDVETGSAVTAPCPYRIVDIADGCAKIRSFSLLDDDAELRRHAEQARFTGLESVVREMLAKSLAEPLLSEVAAELAADMSANYAGNERLTDEDKRRIASIAKDVKRFASLKMSIIFRKVAEAALTDDGTDDDHISILLWGDK